MEKIKVGILGATGMVGQRFIQLLEDHPWFEISELAASERSAGKPYGEAVSGRWKLETPIPDKTASMMVKECKPGLDCKIVFSALDAEIAGTIEEDFAKAGYVVSSNSRNHRMDEDVPLLIPEVNAEHTAMIENQREKYNGKGYIVTNPNCSTIGLVLALAPLHKKYDIKKLIVTTLQALSGAGFPGVPSLDILDNVIPFIGGEEGKMESESLKLLGTLKGGKFVYADIKISASCNRVSVKDGHLECVSIAMDKKPSIDEIILTLKEFNPLKELNLPFSPPQPIIVKEEENRPQPKYDRDLGKGMSSIVGRIRECPVLDYKFLILSHNTIRGAAGAAILNAEYLKVKGLL
ncbi:MAG: aspartate-semialdehyde dehydrogenase [Deltaproteobacteria bacterium]|nr:aspartate-semialdehyde dehydrogenase [Deltaproteobacteria bacterium]